MDSARRATDRALERLERKLLKEYKRTGKEIAEKWNEFLSEKKGVLDSLLETAGKDSAEYQAALYEYTLGNEYYAGMLNETTAQIANVNKTAVAYVNDSVPDVYATNYNFGAKIAKELPKESGVSFKMVNRETVKRLMTDRQLNLLPKRLDIPKDMRWNTKQINSSLLQGILQGESVDKIAKRIEPIMDNNAAAAVRNARTMVTGAENLGRQDSYQALQDDGVIMKKVWIATADERTRESHLVMDGQEVDIDEPFITGDGAQINYPGDPTADPGEVYNCRCSMSTRIVGFRKDDGSIEHIDFVEEPDLHDKQIEKEKGRRSG